MKINAKSILMNALDERWKSYRSQYRMCRSEFSAASVHDLRVSTRRLLAVLDLVRAIDPHPRVQKIRRILKDEMDDFDELRDVQVMLVEISESIPNLPQLSYFRKYLKKRESALLRVAYKQIKSTKISEIGERIKKTGQNIEKLKIKDKEFGLHLVEVANNAYLRSKQDYGLIDAAQISTIHRLRLSFKKFRYLVEVIHALAKGFDESYLERMHNYQSMMGDIQDTETLLNMFSEYVEKHSTSFEPEPVFAFYKQDLAKYVNDFMEDKNEFEMFWNSPITESTLQEEKQYGLVSDQTRHRRGGGTQIRRGQPQAVDTQRPRQDEEDRAGIVGAGDSTGPDPVQPGNQSHGDGEDSGE